MQITLESTRMVMFALKHCVTCNRYLFTCPTPDHRPAPATIRAIMASRESCIRRRCNYGTLTDFVPAGGLRGLVLLQVSKGDPRGKWSSFSTFSLGQILILYIASPQEKLSRDTEVVRA